MKELTFVTELLVITVLLTLSACSENPEDIWVRQKDVKIATDLCAPNGGLQQAGATHWSSDGTSVFAICNDGTRISKFISERTK